MSFTFCPSKVISIHALREEGDQARMRPLSCGENFYPRPPRGGRRMSSPLLWVSFCISIHALREEGDVRLFAFVLSRLKFLSTPSARRATRPLRLHPPHTHISIHALREEGDAETAVRVQAIAHFYPRPPRGGRLFNVSCICCGLTNFYPRPPRGGRLVSTLTQTAQTLFLSTPSARRATRWQRAAWRTSSNFYPRPPRGGRRGDPLQPVHRQGISIHALREEGDSKNGEKHLRFCFIIKRSAQIWKSLSKNIRKNSCDLHRTA